MQTGLVLDKNYKTYYNYKIFRDGTVISPAGKILKKIDLTYPSSHIVLFYKENGKKVRHTVNIAKLIYYLYVLNEKGNPFGPNMIIRFADGNSKNLEPNNLVSYTKKDYFSKMQFCDVQKKFTRKEVRSIVADYPMSREGKRNTIRSLARKHKCSVTVMQKIIHGLYYTDIKEVAR